MKGKLIATAVAAFLVLGGPVIAEPQQDLLQELLDSFQENYGFPGVTATMVLSDGSVVTAAAGVVDAEANAPMAEPDLDRLLDGIPVSPEAPGILYGAGIAVYADTPRGPVYGHGGWIPGYASSLRHYADHGVTVTFQINTDVGIVDDSTDLVPPLTLAPT